MVSINPDITVDVIVCVAKHSPGLGCSFLLSSLHLLIVLYLLSLLFLPHRKGIARDFKGAEICEIMPKRRASAQHEREIVDEEKAKYLPFPIRKNQGTLIFQ